MGNLFKAINRRRKYHEHSEGIEVKNV